MNDLRKNQPLFLALIFLSCSNHVYKTVYPLLSDGKYDSEFPYRNCSTEIKAISASTAKIYSNTQYKVYYFERSDRVTIANFNTAALEKCKSVSFIDNPISGSGVVISSTTGAALLLTCSHVVVHPDTLITYYKNTERERKSYIRTLALKTREQILAAGFPEDGVMQTLGHDPDNDLALIGKNWRQPTEKFIPQFSYPLGKAKELEWGSFVYMLGYPQGQQMVTKAIVSQPNRNGKGAFVLDGNFNRGFSGGIVLAVRDGVPNFELVGLAYSTSGVQEPILTPSPDAEYDMQVPYDGAIYVNSINRINYGITFVTPAETILDFLRAQLSRSGNSGYGRDLLNAIDRLTKIHS